MKIAVSKPSFCPAPKFMFCFVFLFCFFFFISFGRCSRTFQYNKVSLQEVTNHT